MSYALIAVVGLYLADDPAYPPLAPLARSYRQIKPATATATIMVMTIIIIT